MMAMGCDADMETSKKIYNEVKKLDGPQLEYIVTLQDYALMVNKYTEEYCDQVDGVIEAIRDEYDENETGICKYRQVVQFL